MPDNTPVAAFSVALRNDRREISRLSRIVAEFGAMHRLLDDDVLNIDLILDEAVINVIAHGYEDNREHRIDVSLALDGRQLTMTVEDDAMPFNLLEAPPPRLDVPASERRPGGLGIHIIKTLCDRIEWQREKGRNRLTMVLALRGSSVGSASSA
jgi:anti-sigma regulatory factor (Ser/Thr protein kinase)